MKKILLLIFIPFLNVTAFSQTWATVGSGLQYSGLSFTELDDELYVSSYKYDGTSYLQKWDGTSWSVLWTGKNWGIKLETFNNQIYGTYIDSLLKLVVAKFNGTTWDVVGKSNTLTPLYNSSHISIKAHNNELYVSSSFTSFNGINANRIVKWDNSEWNEVGSGLNGDVVGFLSYNNELYVAGEFTQAGTVNTKNIAKWDGSKWDTLGSGLLPYSSSSRLGDYFGGIGFLHNELFISGEYFIGPSGGVQVLTDSVVKWNGAAWSSTGINNNEYNSYTKMINYNNKLYFMKFLSSGRYMKVWDGNNWSQITINNSIVDTMFVNDVFVFKKNLYVAGEIYTNGMKNVGIIKLNDPTTNLSYTVKTTDINIYPNPTTTKLTVELNNFKGENILEIYNINGKTILRQNIENPISQIDMSNVTSGVYFVKLIASEKTVEVWKVIKE